MPDAPLPDAVRRLMAERAEARTSRDWARADALRDELAALGWAVEDAESGSTARPILERGRGEVDETRLDEPAAVPLSIQVVVEEHPEDCERFLNGLAAHPPDVGWELVVVDNDSRRGPPATALEIEPTLVTTAGRLGWADARTLGLRHSCGEITVMVDTSLEPIGDAWSPLLAAFDDPRVGIAGGWGVVSADGRQFEEAPPGEVDAIEGYCLAVRREALRAVRGFDHRFRYYRNADLDFSFAVRDAGWIAVRTEALAFTRHEHRGWASLPEAERDRLSRRNFYRFLDHWGDRRDLLLRPDEP